jgi:hypothetical protein
MSGTTLRRSEREYQRAAKSRRKELERRAKEQASLSAVQQARLDVGTVPNRREAGRTGTVRQLAAEDGYATPEGIRSASKDHRIR